MIGLFSTFYKTIIVSDHFINLYHLLDSINQEVHAINIYFKVSDDIKKIGERRWQECKSLSNCLILMGDDNGEWKTVRRRKACPAGGGSGDATSFFVSGMSDCTSKMDLRKKFAGFGEIVDVYMGTRKNKEGKNFAFVKFIGVEDVHYLEGKMQGVILGG